MVSKAIYLATTMLGAYHIQKRDMKNGYRHLERAIKLLESGDADCKARAVELSGLLTNLYKQCGSFRKSKDESTRLVKIRSSLPRMDLRFRQFIENE